MKTVIIERGKTLDCTDRYYLSFDGATAPMSVYDLLSRRPGMNDELVIVYRSDSGAFGGTTTDLYKSETGYIMDILVRRGILEQERMINGNMGYLKGEKFDA